MICTDPFLIQQDELSLICASVLTLAPTVRGSLLTVLLTVWHGIQHYIMATRLIAVISTHEMQSLSPKCPQTFNLSRQLSSLRALGKVSLH